MSTEPLEYEAGTELDAEAQAFVEKEGKGFVPTPEYDPATDKTLKAKPEAVIDPAAPDVDTDPQPTAEERAAQQGWAPQDQWRGPPDKWVDAETFLKRGDNNPRVLRERLEAAERRSAETIARMERMNQQALERQKADLDAERDRLLEQYAGNPQAVKRIVDNHAQAVNEATAAVTDDTEIKRAQAEWPRSKVAEEDKVFRAAAFQICEELRVQGMRPAEQLAEVDKRLASRFPEYYRDGGSAGNGAPPAGGRSIDGVRVSGSRTTNYASRLPAAARVQGERFVKQGLFKSLEDYAKDYVNS